MSYNKVDKCRGPFIFFIDIDMNQLGTLRYYMIVEITDMLQKNRKTKGFNKNLMKFISIAAKDDKQLLAVVKMNICNN